MGPLAGPPMRGCHVIVSYPQPWVAAHPREVNTHHSLLPSQNDQTSYHANPQNPLLSLHNDQTSYHVNPQNPLMLSLNNDQASNCGQLKVLAGFGPRQRLVDHKQSKVFLNSNIYKAENFSQADKN